MNYKIINGAISYGAETILEEINFEIKEKDKIAIVRKKWKWENNITKVNIRQRNARRRNWRN